LATARIASSWPTTRLTEPLLHLEELLRLALEQSRDRDARPLRDGGRDVSSSTSLGTIGAPSFCWTARASSSAAPSQAREDAVLDLGGAAPVRPAELRLALGFGQRLLGVLDLRLHLGQALHAALLGLPARLERVGLLLEPGQLGVDAGQAVPCGGVVGVAATETGRSRAA